MKKNVVYILVACLVVAIIVVVLVLNKRSTAAKTEMVAEDLNAAVAVRMVAVSDSTYSTKFTSSGLLQAASELPLVSNVSGQIVRIYADEGDRVSKGKVLIQVENELLHSDVSSSEAAYNALKKDYDRFRSANAQGGVTDQQLDNIRTQLIAAESRYISSKRRLADSSVKAPISGSINKRYVEVGSFISPGAKLFDIIDDSALKVMCYATERQMLGLHQGDVVEVTSEALPGETFSGKISFISNKADRSLNFPVEVTLAGDKKQLKSGMLVTAHFNQGGSKQGILIPRGAISGSVQSAAVYTVQQGVARKRPVVAGEMIGENIEILDGLNSGDSIIVAGLINVSDGTKVRNAK